MRYLKIVLVGALLLSATIVFGQQHPMYSQYMYNGLAINPAYAGSHEVLSMTALMRKQWAGLEGAPSTQTISAHVPVERKRIGFGLMVMHDKITVTDQTGLQASYAYKIPTKRGKLSLGIQGGFSHYRSQFSEVLDDDEAFYWKDINEFQPNFGFGVYYSSNRFFLGLSVPQLLQHNMDNSRDGVAARFLRHYFVHTGFLFDLSQNFKLKPNLLVKAVSGAPVEFDLNANLYYKNLLGFGVSWRTMDAVVLMLHVQIAEKLQFGYAYDITTTELRKVSNGSHEIYLNYRLPLSFTNVITPRFF